MGGQIPRVFRGAHDRVGTPATKGKFNHMGFTQINHAGTQQALNGRTGGGAATC